MTESGQIPRKRIYKLWTFLGWVTERAATLTLTFADGIWAINSWATPLGLLAQCSVHRF